MCNKNNPVKYNINETTNTQRNGKQVKQNKVSTFSIQQRYFVQLTFNSIHLSTSLELLSKFQ